MAKSDYGDIQIWVQVGVAEQKYNFGIFNLIVCLVHFSFLLLISRLRQWHETINMKSVYLG